MEAHHTVRANGPAKELVVRWNSEVNRVVRLADIKAYLTGLGIEPDETSPEQFVRLLEREVESGKTG